MQVITEPAKAMIGPDMLYALREMGFTATAPLRAAAEANLALLAPLSGMVPFSREIMAGSDLLIRMTQRYGKPEFGITDVQSGSRTVRVAQETVQEHAFCRLLRFKREDAAEAGLPRVLLVAPLSGHHATLLRDTARALIGDHDVYVTDWTDARDVPVSAGSFGLDDYIDLVRDYLRFLGPGAHVVGVCQPAVPVLAAVALMNADNDPATPSSMTLMGGPIDTRRGPTSVNTFARDHSLAWFEQNVIQPVPWPHAGFMRRVYPGFLQHACFVAMNADRHAKAYRDYYENMVQGDEKAAEAHRRFYDEYNAVLDLPAEFYLDTLRVVFKEFALPLGTMRVRGELVRPDAITRTALFTIEGERDDITGMGQTEAAQDLCSGLKPDMKQHLLAAGVGHYGIFNGRRFREQIYPQIRDFIRRHAGQAAHNMEAAS